MEQRQRSLRKMVGYVLITLFFLICIFSVYQMNLTYHPPVIPAIGLGLRVLVGFFTAIFAWSFYFNKDPPREVIGTRSRLLLVMASLLMIVTYTAFAFQYAMGFMAIDLIFYAGSVSDVLTLFAIFSFLIAVLTIFMEALEGTPTVRPVSIRYMLVNRVVLTVTLAVALTLITTVSISITGRILAVYLPPPIFSIIVQTIGFGFLLALGIILGVGVAVSYYLSFLLYQPLQNLQEETTAITEPGITAYTEPPGLIFSELQTISDSFIGILSEIARIRAELRRFTISEHRLRSPSTSQLSRLDYYFSMLGNQLSNHLQSILSLTEIQADAPDPSALNRVFEQIQTEVRETQQLLESVQLLRLIDAQALPEFKRVDLCAVVPRILAELQELIPDSLNSFNLALPEQSCQVWANEYLAQVFLPLLRLSLETNVHTSSTVDVSISNITELDVTYWQTEISNAKWVLTDVEKSLLFRFNPEEPQRGNPALLVVPLLVEYFRGKFRIENRVPEDAQYGTVLRVLLPVAKRTRILPHRPQRDGDRTG